MKKQISVIISIVLSIFVLFTYQNCGTETASGGVFSKSNDFPIPYDVKVNQIAYMSCSEQKDVSNTEGVFFTFRAGAYGDTAGVRLSDEFLYEARREDDFDKRDILASDSTTAMTRLQFSMRQPNLLSRMFVNADSNDGLEEQDFDFVFGDFGSDEMSASLITLDPGKYMSYWAAGGINKDAYFSTTLVFNGSESLAKTVRENLSGKQWALVFGFADPADPISIRTVNSASEDDEASTSSLTPSGSAYGVGLRVDFKRPSGYTIESMPTRVLKSVREFNLSSPNTEKASWDCPAAYQLKVIHPDDVAVTASRTQAQADALCAKIHDPAVLSDELKLVRRSLPASDWYVNLAQKCVIPRSYEAGSCYGIDQGITTSVTRRTPVYGVNAPCNPALNAGGTGVCAHFVSICIRPN